MYLFVGDKKEFTKGMTNREIARQLDISESFVSTVLCGRRTCSRLVAFAITRLVGRYDLKGYFVKK